jgi:hypothetical protein
MTEDDKATAFDKNRLTSKELANKGYLDGLKKKKAEEKAAKEEKTAKRQVDARGRIGRAGGRLGRGGGRACAAVGFL